MTESMTRPPIQARDPDLAGLRVLVVGCGRSGLAAARLALGKGAQVVVTDARDEAAVGTAADEARRAGARLELGGHPAELADRADLVVLSPGVPPGIELIGRARARGLPVWGEIELAARYARGRSLAITGSNGKSTVTTMVGTIFERAGLPVRVGGNLGRPFAELLDDDPRVVYVLELSSFQLETLESLEPAVAVVLNLSADHLDRYPSLEAYARAKARLLELQSPGDSAVLNADDPPSRVFERHVRGALYLFSTRREVLHGAFLRGERLVLRTMHGEESLLPAGELTVRGEHNVGNALAAALTARLAGCPPRAIADGLAAYRPLPHRLEHVRTVDGVAFYNDSKATNPASTAKALAAFEPGRVHLIAGGKDKGADWDELLDPIRRHCRRVLLVGAARAMLTRRLAGTAELVDCETVGRAVREGLAGATAGDIVLLAPGCASFDQYRNFEERGEDFRRAVLSLTGGESD
jgi:UDP-N-acetylmuramoylalanine--D-glutamate ligase